MRRIVIAGGGVAGLTLAWRITRREPSADVVLLERSARTGGNIRTECSSGYRCEWGPNGFLDTVPATLRLVRDLDLEPRLLPSRDAARRRYVVHGGRLCEIPTSIGSFLRTPLLSLSGKVRLACEPFASPRRADDESIREFARRRIGAEAAAALVDAMVSGMYAGDASALSLRDCFPKMRELEERHGGLVRGLLAARRAGRTGDAPGIPRGRLTSFRDGMSELTDALTCRLGARVRPSTPALRVTWRGALPGTRPRGGRYVVETAGGAFEADAVVLSGPAAESAGLLDGLDPALAADLRGIPTAPLAVLCLGFPRTAIARPGGVEGFGFLVPRAEGLRTLGVLWESSIYEDRAPAGKVLLRVLIGGALDPACATMPDDDLLAIARAELAAVMGLASAPEFVRIVRHHRGIPQYVKGHGARMARLAGRLAAFPGLYLTGSSYRGVSLNACVEEAERLAAHMANPSGELEPAA